MIVVVVIQLQELISHQKFIWMGHFDYNIITDSIPLGLEVQGYNEKFMFFDLVL